MSYKFSLLPQADCPVENIFEGDLYIREIKIPAHALFIGRSHREGHICQLLSGSIVLIDSVSQVALDAPVEIKTDPDYNMVLFALTDVVGRSVHPSRGVRDIATLEAQIYEPAQDMIKLGGVINQMLENGLWLASQPQ